MNIRSAPLLARVALAGAASGLALTAPATLAQVYRCPTPQGMTYSDHPCAPGARPLKLPPPMIVPSVPAENAPDESGDGRDETAEAEADAGGAVSADSSATVKIGMTPAQVRRIQGEPMLVSTQGSAGGQRETWSYVLDGGRRLHVMFEHGHVVALESRRSHSADDSTD